MAAQITRRNRTESAARWQAAAQRAIEGGVQVRQIASTGQWIATSGGDNTTAYVLEVTGAVAHGCDCLAGLNGDPVCRHKAAYYLMVGALSVDPEPEPPAPARITFAGSTDRQEIRIDGERYGDAMYWDDAGWVVFAGCFPTAWRVGSFCTLTEVERELAARLPVAFPVPQVEPAVAWTVAAA